MECAEVPGSACSASQIPSWRADNLKSQIEEVQSELARPTARIEDYRWHFNLVVERTFQYSRAEVWVEHLCLREKHDCARLLSSNNVGNLANQAIASTEDVSNRVIHLFLIYIMFNLQPCLPALGGIDEIPEQIGERDACDFHPCIPQLGRPDGNTPFDF